MTVVNDHIAYMPEQSSKPDVLSRLLHSSRLEKEFAIDPHTLSNELQGLVVGGSDPVAHTLTYLFWELARNPTLQEELYRSLKAMHCSTEAERFMDSSLLLDAILKETLRCYPPAPTGGMRESPPGGAYIGGSFLPEGVSCAAAMV